MSKQNGFHVVTPLLESAGMSKRMGTTVFLKMESAQPTGSFKIRGIGHMCQNVRKYIGVFHKSKHHNICLTKHIKLLNVNDVAITKSFIESNVYFPQAMPLMRVHTAL